MDNLEKEIEKLAMQKVDEKETIIVEKNPQLNVQIDTSKPYTEQASQIVGVMATQKAMNDQQLFDDITEKKKEELKHSAEAHLKSEKAQSKNADKKLQEADYGVYDGVATYAGIKKPLPSKMQKILFTMLSAMQTLWLLIFGTVTSFINITCDCIDSTVKKLGSIAKSARILVLSLLCVGGIALVIYVIINILQNYGIIGQVI